MLHVLGGGSEHSATEYYGRTITATKMGLRGVSKYSWRSEKVDTLRMTFDDGVEIDIWDDGQSCCESRYMTTDDDVQSLVGRKLLRIESKPGPEKSEGGDDDWGDVQETIFVEVGTDAGFITLVNHNEHTGYYGGFGLTITEVKKDAEPTF